MVFACYYEQLLVALARFDALHSLANKIILLFIESNLDNT